LSTVAKLTIELFGGNENNVGLEWGLIETSYPGDCGSYSGQVQGCDGVAARSERIVSLSVSEEYCRLILMNNQLRAPSDIFYRVTPDYVVGAR
jgi:hypothetical protein